MPPTVAPERVTLPEGEVGGRVDGPVLAFKGIPFAAPPVGELRWRPPQPPAAWTGVRSAAAYGPDCMQEPFPGDAAPLGVAPAEDCLYLNVWRPAAAGAAKLPVMVWIYGGGFVNGGSSPAVYDGSAFARDGVVFVSFNYRIGRFGFFAHPALTAEAGGDPLGNYGYLDQIAALQWVQRNIARFGGDPDKVTLFGESAGGASALALMTSPMAKGLFHRVIVQSGGGRGSLLPMRRIGEAVGALASAESVGVAFARSVGVEGADAAALAALRALPAEVVTAGLNMATMDVDTYVGGPMLDGKIVVGDPETLIRAGESAKIPLMAGATSDDIGFPQAESKEALFAAFDDRAAAARALYDPTGEAPLLSVRQAVAADQLMIEPARLLCRLVSEQGLPAYHYRFSYVAASMRAEWSAGAPHATEIPYAFDTVAARYGADLTADDAAVARAMHAYWVAFSRDGSPGDAGGTAWAPFAGAPDHVLDFTAAGPRFRKDPWKARLDLVEAAR